RGHGRAIFGAINDPRRGSMSIVDAHRAARRVRVERAIYQQPNGRYAVCFMVDGKPRFRTVGHDLEAARAARSALADAARRGEVPVAPSFRLGTVADRWIARYATLVAAINGVSAR